jgi:hypothetical protein
MSKTLKRAVVVDGVLLHEGTVLTEDQASKVRNPRAFADAADATGPDANDAREFQANADNDADADTDDDKAPTNLVVTDDSAATGARLARGGKTAAPRAGN